MKRVLIALAMAAAVAGCSRTSSPESVVEEFMRAGETGRCDALPDLLTTESRQMLGDKLKQSCQQSAQQNKAKEGQKTLRSLQVLDRREDGDKVTLRLQPTFSDNSTQPPASFVLLRQEGRWRLDLMQTAAANGKNEGMGGPGAAGPQMPGAPGAAPAEPPAAGNTTTTTTNSTTTTTEGEADESGNSAE